MIKKETDVLPDSELYNSMIKNQVYINQAIYFP